MSESDTTLPGLVSGEYDLGEMIGSRKAFGAVAGRCSAAAVASMKRIRDEKLYKCRAESWGEFCQPHLGMTKANANRLIRLFVELGPEYFHLSQLMRISPQEYRALGPAVKDGALHRNGEAIALIPENSEKIAEAMAALRGETGATPVRPSPIAALPSLEKRGLKLAQEFGEMLRRGPSDDHRAQIKAALGGVLRALHRVEIDHR